MDIQYTDADLSKIESDVQLVECLTSKFKLVKFRPMQKDIIEAVLEKRDVLAVMATGHGKSLCFQLPALLKNGITLVISPLISLMQSQVHSMVKIGVSACLLGSAQNDTTILQRVFGYEFSIVYCCPEYLQGLNGKKLMTTLKDRLTLVAIDEAHSISQWGHEFRQDYLKLNIIRDIIPNVPILAVTATATKDVRNEIIRMARLNAPLVIVTELDRPNLEFLIKRKSVGNPWRDLKPLMENVTGSVIIYVLRIVETDEVQEALAEHGIESSTYHADLPMTTRSDIVTKFVENEIKVVVATISFGMGIDKPDVRLVIHYGASKSIESYYQEVGRAGRDGLHAKVVTFFDENDFQLQEFFLTHRKDPLPTLTLTNLRRLRAEFRQYLFSTTCRRKTILDYFGEDTTSIASRENCCDNCSRAINPSNSSSPPTRLQSYRTGYTSSIIDLFFPDFDFNDDYDSEDVSNYDEYCYYNGSEDLNEHESEQESEHESERESERQSEHESSDGSNLRQDVDEEEQETSFESKNASHINQTTDAGETNSEGSIGEIAAKRPRLS
ncbi:Werner syndrome ATP-dependent helicase-like isoform X2 [Bradysia coprophila]|uniref:Werner syndrome ATP-dependent helicase-like isoform X2 n=1 Tax=Bradysia coprophila TaxID=38358 RepID=UPI00187D9BE6|nr:Werner syndrome ATP-dependent helicase-like isoform X2 [Bradysia coprophila]